jgi:nucleotide-binding universal stress UspA family protein
MSTDAAHEDRSSDIETFVVPLDGSHTSETALPVTARLAARMGARIEVFSAVTDDEEVTERTRALDAVHLPGIEVERTVVVDRAPVDAIVGISRRPGHQLSLATQGRGRSGAVMGSVALKALGLLGRPVLCVGPRVERGSSIDPALGVVVCLDGSEEAEAAIEPAAWWARRLREPLTLLTVVADAPPPVEGRAQRRSFGLDDPEGYLEQQAATLDGTVPSVVVRVAVDPLHPGGAIQSLLADEAATMVVARTRGRSGLARAVLGSSAALIVQHSSVPVLLVP